MCKRIFQFELQLSSHWQNFKFSRYCLKFHIFTKFVIFQVYLQLFRPTASSLYILWQGHVKDNLFHFASCKPLKQCVLPSFFRCLVRIRIAGICHKEGRQQIIFTTNTANRYKNESDRRLITNGHCSEILTYALSHKCKIGGTLQFKLL